DDGGCEASSCQKKASRPVVVFVRRDEPAAEARRHGLSRSREERRRTRRSSADQLVEINEFHDTFRPTRGQPIRPLQESVIWKRATRREFQIPSSTFVAPETLDERSRIGTTAKRVGLARRIHGHQRAIDRVAL